MSLANRTSPATERIYALDALRASTMILGVFLHGAVAYMTLPMPGLLWPVSEPSSGPGFDLVLWYLHGFRIPLFFIVAGFFASLLCEIRGCHEFAKQRLRRIGVPLLAAVLVILPACYYLWGLGLMEQDVVSWREVKRMSFHDKVLKSELLGLGHLWFLQYLLLYSLVYYLVRIGWPAVFKSPVRFRLLERGWWPLTLLSVMFPMLWLRPEIYTHFENQWWPDAWEFAYYAIFYLSGALLYRVYGQFSRIMLLGPAFTVTSLIIFCFVFLQLKDRLGGQAVTEPDWVFALSVALYSWFAVWGMLGLFLKVFDKPSRWVRYLSDAAYWIYLVHLPLLVAMQLMLGDMENRFGISAAPMAGFTFSVSFTLALALLGYQFFVRYTVIGKWLHGPKSRHKV
ncbi:MAG: acyltransferase family protein [Xanthomonadales bacterium]|nr:acyltransferase family protein [Gammaproteobacteria bacterium]MBT8052290.1 acyltransferase family protein [Gammaproteobacteria bacterium]NND56903.1 acyltransferase family protein [Xanthomonadales bacterium]NNK51514.1 acyltransferase family protein [Xanthomonadales bacterium]